MKRKGLITIIFVTVVGVLIILGVNSVSATTPCYDLPKYTSQLESYYESVRVGKDPCYPSFSFKTPASYSKFGVAYNVFLHDFPDYTTTIEEYDAKLRNRITKIESCPDLPKYLKLVTDEQLSKLNTNYFLDEKRESCSDLSGALEYMTNEKIINGFLDSQGRFGDYTICKRTSDGSPRSVYVICDNRVKENIRLVVEDGKVVEAYFQNSYSESYRKIYPEDMFIRKRNPAWERMQNIQRNIMLAAGGLIMLLLVIGLVVFKKKKLFLKKK